jgi:hypothetical protein
MTSNEPRTVEQITTEIDLVTDLRTAATGNEKGRQTKRLKALVAELATVQKKRGRFADLDEAIQAVIAAGGVDDRKAVTEKLGEGANDQPVAWRLSFLAKTGVIDARFGPAKKTAKAEQATPEETAPTATVVEGGSQVVEAS